MGDRIYLRLECAYCGKMNPEDEKNTCIYDWTCYAESCGITTFICEYCKKENQIVENYQAVKHEALRQRRIPNKKRSKKA